MEHLEDQKLQYEKKLKATKVKRFAWLVGFAINHQCPNSTANCPLNFPERCPIRCSSQLSESFSFAQVLLFSDTYVFLGSLSSLSILKCGRNRFNTSLVLFLMNSFYALAWFLGIYLSFLCFSFSQTLPSIMSITIFNWFLESFFLLIIFSTKATCVCLLQTLNDSNILVHLKLFWL